MLITINENTNAEIVEKKSKFIANLFYVQSEQEAEEKLKEIRKKYYDARHNCYAYSIISGNSIINKEADDGEPNGTAGMPILNILIKKELVNVLVVVTRYFGGVLLGTGGLVKAYSEATISALEKTSFSKIENGLEMEVILGYPDFEKFQYYIQKNNLKITNAKYSENIICRIELTNEEKSNLISLIENDTLKIQKYNILQHKLIKKRIDKKENFGKT